MVGNHPGAVRVMAISDSSPSDDGTTTTAGKALHNSYTINSNRAFFLNATAYLAGDGATGARTVSLKHAKYGTDGTANRVNFDDFTITGY